eukprot:m.279166 g.279166  ORF g.279166 m.279166 type:complete len:835 (-) comp19800_c0_seq2:1896-4400(-)
MVHQPVQGCTQSVCAKAILLIVVMVNITPAFSEGEIEHTFTEDSVISIIEKNSASLEVATPEDLIGLANGTDGILHQLVNVNGDLRADVADAAVEFIDKFAAVLGDVVVSNASFADDVVFEFVNTLADVCEALMQSNLNISEMSTKAISTLERAFEDSAEVISNISHDSSLKFSRSRVSGLLTFVNDEMKGFGASVYSGYTCQFAFDERLWTGFGHVGIMFFEFTDSDLFTRNKTHIVGSHVISVETSVHETMLNARLAQFPACGKYDFTVNGNESVSDDMYAWKPVCAFYDAELQVWSTSGCTTTVLNDSHAQCCCTHLTTFAILVTGTDISGVDEIVLTAVTYVGICLSLCSIILSMIPIIAKRKLRNDVRFQILLNLIFSLGMALLLFCFIVQPRNSPGCEVLSAGLMYFWVANFLWMMIESHHLYQTFVVVFTARSTWIPKIVRLLLIGWGIPVVLVAISMRWFEAFATHQAGEVVVCWIDFDSNVRFFFIVPLVVSVVVNFASTIVIYRAIRRHQRSSGIDAGSMVHATKVWFSISSITGLGWTFAVLVIWLPNIAFVYLFALSNAFQGTAIFYYHIVGNDTAMEFYTELGVWVEVRTGWNCTRWCSSSRKATPNSEHDTTSAPMAPNDTHGTAAAPNSTDHDCSTSGTGNKSLPLPSGEHDFERPTHVYQKKVVLRESNSHGQHRKRQRRQLPQHKSTTVRRRPEWSLQFLTRQTQYYHTHEATSSSPPLALSAHIANNADVSVPTAAQPISQRPPALPGPTTCVPDVESRDIVEATQSDDSIISNLEAITEQSEQQRNASDNDDIGRSCSYVVSVRSSTHDNREFLI